MLTGLARERAYLVAPSYYQKRQMTVDPFTTMQILRDLHQTAEKERQRQKAIDINGRLFAAGGRR
uniref:Corticotropin-releasing hormone 3 n=1 Tax=Ophionotus victoriae TaxID=667017 RepID=A0A220W0J7_9ECHI|nr:corticotropin-releasing hormone 3 precursor [Ophionotus victoriae]